MQRSQIRTDIVATDMLKVTPRPRYRIVDPYDVIREPVEPG